VPPRLVAPELERFVARHFGARGRDWLDRLPRRVEHYQGAWELEIEGLLPGGLMSCCLAVKTARGQAAVLKLSGPWTPASVEALALEAWDGGPAPKLLRADDAGAALLLERIYSAEPFGGGTTAGEMRRIAELLKALHAVPVSVELKGELPSLAAVVEKQISTAGDEAGARSAAEALELRPRLELARARAAELLSSWDGDDVLLHGDLENKNVLSCGRRGLVAVDPAPCIGDPAYDAAYWVAAAVAASARDDASTSLAELLGLDPARLRAWAAVVALER
jgi:streptomycin 6-kinase